MNKFYFPELPYFDTICMSCIIPYSQMTFPFFSHNTLKDISAWLLKQNFKVFFERKVIHNTVQKKVAKWRKIGKSRATKFFEEIDFFWNDIFFFIFVPQKNLVTRYDFRQLWPSKEGQHHTLRKSCFFAKIAMKSSKIT